VSRLRTEFHLLALGREREIFDFHSLIADRFGVTPNENTNRNFPNILVCVCVCVALCGMFFCRAGPRCFPSLFLFRLRARKLSRLNDDGRDARRRGTTTKEREKELFVRTGRFASVFSAREERATNTGRLPCGGVCRATRDGILRQWLRRARLRAAWHGTVWRGVVWRGVVWRARHGVVFVGGCSSWFCVLCPCVTSHTKELYTLSPCIF